MNKDLESIINKLVEEFKHVNINQAKALINFDSAIEDMPISTGKRLVINYLEFNGQKKNGESINFIKEFEQGVNIIIADNLRGKSTVFKVLKAALTGDVNSIKADVKQWIKNVTLGFKISNKDYTVMISLEKRFKGILYSIPWKELADVNSIDDKIIFQANNNTKYYDEIQKFFFNQFSYYSLKWTQKSSAKDSNDLVEASASWKTYYKSIYLESKDSVSFYGGQDQKVFQMLLGFEYTNLINHLSVKRDMLLFELSKHKEFENRKDNAAKNENGEIEHKLEQIQGKLEQINNNSLMQELSRLQNEYNRMIRKLNHTNTGTLKTSQESQRAIKKQAELLRKLEEYEYEERRIRKEMIRYNRLLNDLLEYIEIGQFFSNLDIKCCPSCNQEVNNHHSQIDEICPLCHEHVKIDDENRQVYLHKIEETKTLLKKLENEISLIKVKIQEIKDNLEQANREVEVIRNQLKLQGKYEEEMESELSNIIGNINLVRQNSSDISEEEKKLIAERAVLLYKRDSASDNSNEQIIVEKMEEELKVLNSAIDFLDQKRYEKSKNILDTLASMMLAEIHEFGLESITDIEIDNKFNVTYIQNDVSMKFDDIAEGEQLRVKLAFYLGLMQLDIEKNFGRHTRFLIIDSPNKEEGDSKYLEGLKDVLININDRYGENLQIIIGTATRELENVLKNQTVYPKGDYVF
ncbi:hypothetical protein [Paenibacillus rigui]|uniref:Nuclease SbcCD subunit C n=1 Tax=Paenibacillus rigui TaxID=554312 RepID=A0A229UTX3_9BACL|nr:hypothetical protein [Paenibacillus rigui]OXM87067.1 hypothetical protein CF651_07045 [Paenibacillus rigui]